MKEESRFTLNFGNIEYNTYVLYKSKPFFSDEKIYVRAFNRKGESIAVKHIDISDWERVIYASGFLNKVKNNPSLGKNLYGSMKTEEFLSRLKFFKGSQADVFLSNRLIISTQNAVIFSLHPSNNNYNYISYCGHLWKLSHAQMIPCGNEMNRLQDKKYDTIIIKLKDIDNQNIIKEISFESSTFQRCFLTYWALYIWFQFSQVNINNNAINKIGIFDELRNPLHYYKWLENYKMVDVPD